MVLRVTLFLACFAALTASAEDFWAFKSPETQS